MELRIREVDIKAGARSKGSNGGVAVGLPHRNYSVFKQAHINHSKVKVVEVRRQTHPAQWVGFRALRRGLGVGGRKSKSKKESKSKRPMDCVPWVACFELIKANPTQRSGWGKVVFKAHGLRSMGLFFLLAHEDAAWVGLFAAIEFKQEIQSWEAKCFNMRAAAWACACDNICSAIAVAIVYTNTNATGKVFCIGHELCK